MTHTRGKQAPTLQRMRESAPRPRVEVIPPADVLRAQDEAKRLPWSPLDVAHMLAAHFAVEHVEAVQANGEVCWAVITTDDEQVFKVRVERGMRTRPFDDRA